MARVSVIFPCLPDGQWRDQVFEWITRRYETLWPEFELCIGSNDDDPFSRSKAKNEAYRKATGEIIIINDADTFCNRQFLELALEQVVSGQSPWVLPYRTYYNLAQGFTERVIERPPTIELSERELEFDFRVDEQRHPPDGSVAGVLVMPREAFDAVDGYDENFRGWGYEDDAFACALDTLWGYHDRISSGFCTHLWHPPAPDGDFKNPHMFSNRKLWEDYRLAANNPDRMRQIRI